MRGQYYAVGNNMFSLCNQIERQQIPVRLRAIHLEKFNNKGAVSAFIQNILI